MFEYAGKFFNPRLVFMIGQVEQVSDKWFAFEVVWTSGQRETYGYDTLSQAEQKQRALRHQVDKTNNGGS